MRPSKTKQDPQPQASQAPSQAIINHAPRLARPVLPCFFGFLLVVTGVVTGEHLRFHCCGCCSRTSIIDKLHFTSLLLLPRSSLPPLWISPSSNRPVAILLLPTISYSIPPLCHLFICLSRPPGHLARSVVNHSYDHSTRAPSISSFQSQTCHLRSILYSVSPRCSLAADPAVGPPQTIVSSESSFFGTVTALLCAYSRTPREAVQSIIVHHRCIIGNQVTRSSIGGRSKQTCRLRLQRRIMRYHHTSPGREVVQWRKDERTGA